MNCLSLILAVGSQLFVETEIYVKVPPLINSSCSL